MSTTIEPTTIFRRRREYTVRPYCAECGEVVAVDAEFVLTPEGSKHLLCAGMAHDIVSCPSCFMVPKDCTC